MWSATLVRSPKLLLACCGKSSFSVQIVCRQYQKFQAGNTFFLRMRPNGQVKSSKTDTTRRFSTDPSATLSFSQSRSLPLSLVARKPTKAQV